jgi:hydrogenase/urease accessory protein HupE
MNKYISQFATLLFLTSFATAASAHEGLHEVSDFLSGFTHPFLGLDHILLMVGVGFLASRFKLAIGLTIGLFASFTLLHLLTHSLMLNDYAFGFIFATTILNNIGLVLGALLLKPQAVRLKI